MSHPESDFQDLMGSHSSAQHNNHSDDTPAALLEQLVYIDNLMPDADPSTFDAQLSAELAAFADESFIFPDEDKPSLPEDTFEESSSAHSGLNGNNHSHSNSNNSASSYQRVADSFRMPPPSNPPSALYAHQTVPTTITELLRASEPKVKQENSSDALSRVPKVPVPPGAQSTLSAAGLSQNQIDALAALIAQQQQPSPNPQSQPHSRSHSRSQPSLQSPSTHNQSLDVATLLNPPRRESIPDKATPDEKDGSAEPFDSNNAVDLDKRKRNTAASARFRVKKKMKEQEMERNLKELNDRNTRLEMKIQQLEMENRLLRNLVVEKGAQRDTEELERLRKRAKFSVDEETIH
ncbi:unnamed protein product [Kuraishia capsulata CBS 1993]|uniref:BZIP domain-containing protein n=1 Tax=Kuraishia capsulata CBS 1993 TaxID=1382522 RepID=W6MWR3_9ASCO|nr:uncharacterized protein KUCA_T00003754001 [Kuraishia capsulata CBS 1993]CDK27775.1 unnamed protein product [Kuraishia capsulata CBS 1993]